MRINGLGYCVTDNLYSPIDFESEGYKKWLSDNNNDIGLITGGLVFAKELERSSGKSYRDILNEITGRIDPKINIGGPAIVAMINIVQMVDENEVSIGYFGARGDDKSGCYIADKLKAMNIDLSGYITVRGQTSFTDVLSDPSYNSNNGERSFVCYIGTGGTLSGKDILDSFFDADILIYGGTGLTPGLHDDLSYLLKKGKKANCLNFVNTVYDFRNEKLNPGKPWPLVEEEEDFYLIDLLITDNEEALKISGQKSKEKAVAYFADRGISSVIVTHGTEDLICYSDGSLFKETGVINMPVSKSAGEKIRSLPDNSGADTTGCGDNFAGGVYASVALQLKNNKTEKPSLKLATAWGVVSGGFTGLYQGGVYIEKKQGEKLEKLKVFFNEYIEQTGYMLNGHSER